MARHRNWNDLISLRPRLSNISNSKLCARLGNPKRRGRWWRKERRSNPSTNHLIGHSESVCACSLSLSLFLRSNNKRQHHVLHLNIYDWQWDERLLNKHQKFSWRLFAQPDAPPSSVNVFLPPLFRQLFFFFLIFTQSWTLWMALRLPNMDDLYIVPEW